MESFSCNEKYFLIIAISVTGLFIFGVGNKNAIHAVTTAQELVAQCKQNIADLEKQAERTADSDKKASLYRQASEKGFSCLKQGLSDFPNSSDMPRIAADDYGESRNYLKYCNSAIAQKEKEIAPVQDPDRRIAMLDDLMSFTAQCHKFFASDLAYLRSPERLPRLGTDDLHLTTNFVNNCKAIISLKNQKLQNMANPMDRFVALPDLVSYSMQCILGAGADIFDQNLVPVIAHDDLQETTNVVNNCSSIINDLKSKYDPLSCEPKDVESRSNVVKNLKIVESWCKDILSSDFMKQSLAPDFSKDPYGTSEFYTNRVCGIAPEPEPSSSGTKTQTTPVVTATNKDKFNCEYFNSGWLTPDEKKEEALDFCDYKQKDFADGVLINSKGFTIYGAPSWTEENPGAVSDYISKLEKDISTYPGDIPDHGSNINIGQSYTEGSAGDLYEFKKINTGDFGTQKHEVTYSNMILDDGATSLRIESGTGISSQFRVGLCSVVVFENAWKKDFKRQALLALPHFFSDEVLAKVNAKAEDIAQKLRGYSTCSAENTKAEPQPEENLSQFIQSLIGSAPADDDLKFSPKPSDMPSEKKWPDLSEQPTKKPLTATVAELDGTADIQLADGSWVAIEKGSFIPTDAIVHTGFGSTMKLHFSDNLEIIMRSLEDVSMKIFKENASVYRRELKLETGELRFKVLEGDWKTDMRVSTPNSTASPEGTDFGVSYDKKTGATIWEIYDGTLLITDKINGRVEILSSSYGKPIKRLEIFKDGTMINQTAIPKSEWLTFQAQGQSSARSSNKGWFIALALIAVAGYFGYKKRELLLSLLRPKNIS